MLDPIGLSIPETGKMLGGPDKPLSRATIYRLVNEGKLKKLKIGTRSIISVPSIRALAAEMEAA